MVEEEKLPLPIILGVNFLEGGGGDDGDLFRLTKLRIINHTVDEER